MVLMAIGNAIVAAGFAVVSIRGHVVQGPLVLVGVFVFIAGFEFGPGAGMEKAVDFRVSGGQIHPDHDEIFGCVLDNSAMMEGNAFHPPAG